MKSIESFALSLKEAVALVELIEEDSRPDDVRDVSTRLRAQFGMPALWKVLEAARRRGEATQYARVRKVCARRFGISESTSAMDMVDITLKRCRVLAEKPKNWREARAMLIAMHDRITPLATA